MPMKRMLLTFLMIVLLVLVGGGGFYAYQTFFAAPIDPNSVEAPPPEPKITMGPVYPLDPFLVNLADPGRPRFLKVVLELELDQETVRPELDALQPKVRDSLLTLLSSKASEDLSTVADKERLRNEIIHRLNAFLASGRVAEVYFTQFVVQ